MQKVQINLYKGHGVKDIKIIEVPKGLKPGEVMVLAGKSLTPEENARLWDWQFIHNNTMTKEEFKAKYLVKTRIRINNEEECNEFQRIAYEFGLTNSVGTTSLISYHHPVRPDFKDWNMKNLFCFSYGLAQSSIFHCDEYKEIHYNELIEDYKTIKS